MSPVIALAVFDNNCSGVYPLALPYPPLLSDSYCNFDQVKFSPAKKLNPSLLVIATQPEQRE